MYNRILDFVIMDSGKLDHQEHEIGVSFFFLQKQNSITYITGKQNAKLPDIISLCCHFMYVQCSH